MFQINNKNTRNLTPFSTVSIVEFEQVNISWVSFSFSRRILITFRTLHLVHYYKNVQYKIFVHPRFVWSERIVVK